MDLMKIINLNSLSEVESLYRYVSMLITTFKLQLTSKGWNIVSPLSATNWIVICFSFSTYTNMQIKLIYVLFIK